LFDKLTGRLADVLNRLRGKGVVTADDVQESMREIRRALLEADVNFRVAKQFVDAVSEGAAGERVLRSLTPGQQIVGIVHEEMIKLLGDVPSPPDLGGRPPVVWMVAGLQGSGKTTTVAKLARWASTKRSRRPLLAACDLQRPAAIDQLEVLSSKAGVGFFCNRASSSPVEVAREALAEADRHMYDLLVLDTAGRLHVDEDLMEQLREVRNSVQPRETFLVLDGLSGQDALKVAEEFDRRAGYTSAILTKMDGDSRGGAALSFAAVTGKPIRFLGIGEGVDGLELFDPGRMSGRILGMGDILGLVEKAQENADVEEARKLEKKLRNASFTLEDFAGELRKLRKMGPIQDLLGMLPGRMLPPGLNVEQSQLVRMQAIVDSMTPAERIRPEILDGSRRKRIARGSGTTVREVNRLLQEFRAMKTMLKRVGKSGRFASLFRP
jgi:signal recognition particle subunit SRP54